MSLWTCIACSTRRAVGLDTCPQCGAADHEDGDTISGPDGVQGARHIPEAYPQPIETPPVAVPAPRPATDTPPAPEAPKEQP